MSSCVAGCPERRVSGFVLARPRLFAELNDARSRRRIVWVWGVPGAGKTTLLASYAAQQGIECVWCRLSGADRGLAQLSRRLAHAAERLARARREPGSRLPEPDFGSSVSVLESHPESSAAAFAKRFVEALCRELPAPRFVVLDDAHTLSARESLATLLSALSSLQPSEVSLLVASREPPSRELDRLVARGLLGAIDDRTLRFTARETSRLVRTRIGREACAQTVLAVQGHTGGWAAAVCLTLDLLPNEMKRAAADQRSPAVAGWFDDCVSRLLSSVPESTRDLILKTACLPWLTPAVVSELAGAEALGSLTELVVRGHLTVLPGGECRYAYSSLLGSYFAREAERALSRDERTRLIRIAARRLANDGDAESALELLREAKDAEGLAEMAVREAPRLLARGLQVPLADWLDWASLELGGTTPWIWFWLAFARLAFDPRAATRPAQASYWAFEQTGSRAGMRCAWAAVVESLAESRQDLALLDSWLARLGEIFEPCKDDTDPELEAFVVASAVRGLSLRRPGDPALSRWAKRGMVLLGSSCSAGTLGKLAKALLDCYEWQGAPGRVEVVTGAVKAIAASTDDPGVRALAYHAEALVARQRGCPEQGQTLLRRGLSWSRTVGLGRLSSLLCMDSVLCSLSARDPSGARAGLDRLRAESRDSGSAGFYHFLESWRTLLCNKLDTAQEHAMVALSVATRAGDLTLEMLSRLALAEVAIEQGCRQDAHAQLGAALSMASSLSSPVFDLAISFLEAQLCLYEQISDPELEPSGHPELARRLDVLLQLARRSGRYTLSPLPLRAESASRVLDAALSLPGSEPVAHRLVRANQLDGFAPSLDSVAWPWRVRVFTLGRFSLVVGGEPVRFAGKTQKRPLELLKALVAFGGREVCERRLSDALWPDSEGDAAERALATTLHRLRALVGDERALTRRGRTLTLDARRVWVDVWALERGLSRASRLPAEQKPQALDGLLPLYQQPFLAAESASWATLTRERVRSKYLRAVGELCALYVEKQDIERAANVCLRGLEAEPLAENLYVELMDVYARLGRPSEVRAVFRRCQASVASCDTAPSADVVAAYERLKSA